VRTLRTAGPLVLEVADVAELQATGVGEDAGVGVEDPQLWTGTVGRDAAGVGEIAVARDPIWPRFPILANRHPFWHPVGNGSKERGG
jgi:hypothetical protein